MATQLSTIKLEMNKDTIKYFDELLNIDIARRPSDSGLQDDASMMVKPRAPLDPIDSTIPSVTQNCSNIFFYTDKSKVTRAYRVRNITTNNTRTHWLEYATVTVSTGGFVSFGTWTQLLNINNSTNAHTNYKFDVVRIPSYTSAEPTLYSTPTAGTVVDRVPKAGGDTLGAGAIGRILMIQSGVYEGVYAAVTGFDSTNNEYIIEGSGAIIPFAASTGYRIYDALSDNLMVYSDQVIDYYIDGIVERGDIRQTATDSMRAARIIGGGDFIKQQMLFANKRWTFAGATLFASSGLPGNPFFYSLVGGYTIGNKEITGIFEYKNRIIAYGRTFIYAIDTNFKIEKLSDSYGIRDNSIIETGNDAYFISTQGKVASMNETSAGSLYINNIANLASLYTKDFISDTFAGADGTNIYFGGRNTSGAFKSSGFLVVYNLAYKFWSVYQTPAVSGITTFNSIAYFRDAILPTHRAFANFLVANQYFECQELYADAANITTVSTTSTQTFLQRIATRNIVGKNIFNARKTIKNVHLWLENNTGDSAVKISTYKYLDRKFSQSLDRTITQSPILSEGTGVGSGTTGLEQTGGSDIIALSASVPRLYTEAFKTDYANIWRIIFDSVGTTGFYINLILIEVEEEVKDIFVSPSSIS